MPDHKITIKIPKIYTPNNEPWPLTRPPSLLNIPVAMVPHIPQPKCKGAASIGSSIYNFINNSDKL